MFKTGERLDQTSISDLIQPVGRLDLPFDIHLVRGSRTEKILSPRGALSPSIAAELFRIAESGFFTDTNSLSHDRPDLPRHKFVVAEPLSL